MPVYLFIYYYFVIFTISINEKIGLFAKVGDHLDHRGGNYRGG